MFFVGQQVICINTSNWPPPAHFPGYEPAFPRKGIVYTVRAIAPRRIYGHDEDGLFLTEIVNPVIYVRSRDGTTRESELAFRMSRFRPLRATNIDLFLQMLEPQPSGDLVEPYMSKPRQPLVLQAHANVVDIRELRRAHVKPDPTEWVLFIDPPPPPDSRAAQMQAAGLARYIRQQEAQNARMAAPGRRPRPKWLMAILGLARRLRPS